MKNNPEYRLIKLSSLKDNSEPVSLLDIIQFVHRNNNLYKQFGISYRPNPNILEFGKPKMEMFLETSDAHILNAVQKKWPDCEIGDLEYWKNQ